MSLQARLTAEDLWRRPRFDGCRELINGEIVELAPVGFLHGRVTGKVSYYLGKYVEAQEGGHVLTGDPGFVLALPNDPERVRAPDVAVVSASRVAVGALPVKFFHGAPDLVVEVLSHSDRAAEVGQRIRDWLDGGACLVWAIAPTSRTATVYRPDGSARLLREREALDGEDVLPGLSIPLSALLD
jgi:Uma2 family endonuclease